LTAIVMIALSTAYHISTGAGAETLVISLSCVTVSAMVAFPWRALPQLVVALASVAAFSVSVAHGSVVSGAFAPQLAGLAVIAASTVLSVSLAEEYRRRMFRLASIVASRAAIVSEPSF
jgi:hypothetical protein